MSLRSLSPLFGKKVLLLTHAGADVDSFASAAAIHFSLHGKARTFIGVPEHLNLNAKALAKKLSVPYKINPRFSGFDAVVCFDFNKSSMLGPLAGDYASFEGEKFLVDHHSEEKEKLAPEKNIFASKKAVSTTELVYKLLKNTRGISVPKKAYACIAAGIITDSSSFLIADHGTFRIMAEVMEKAEMPYSEIVSLFSLEKDSSEKIACLKAAKRVHVYKSGSAIIAASEIGAFEADAASSLVRLGADVAFCGYSEGGILRISGRVNNRWLGKKHFDLAKHVFNRLESLVEGEGGGHPGAAGFNGKGEIAPALEHCVRLTHEFMVQKEKGAQLKEYS